MNLITTKSELLELATTAFLQGMESMPKSEVIKCRDFEDIQHLDNENYSIAIESAVDKFIINESKYGL